MSHNTTILVDGSHHDRWSRHTTKSRFQVALKCTYPPLMPCWFCFCSRDCTIMIRMSSLVSAWSNLDSQFVIHILKTSKIFFKMEIKRENEIFFNMENILISNTRICDIVPQKQTFRICLLFSCPMFCPFSVSWSYVIGPLMYRLCELACWWDVDLGLWQNPSPH